MLKFPLLVCPIDHLPLEEVAGGLTCTAGHKYQTRLGISRLLTAESNYADAFGEQWNQYRITQLDSYTNTTISKDRLKRCLGDVLWKKLNQKERVEILEAGCGAGRFTEVLLDLPAASVTSTDLSSAVEPNQLNCPQSNQHRIIQCDINQLPFLPEQYDVVLCIGVIQHTEDPEQTIAGLYGQVKPGGYLVIDHYTHMLSRYTKVTSLILRSILKRLPPKQGIYITERLVRFFFPLHRAVRRKRLLQVLLSRISPCVTYYNSYPEFNDKLQYEWSLLDTYDSLTDYYKHMRTCSQIRNTLTCLGAQDIWVAKGGNGIEARCRKPIQPQGKLNASSLDTQF